MSVTHVHSVTQYEELMKTPNKLIVVDFSAAWCGPCKKIAPTYEAYAKQYPDALLLHVDVDELSALPEVKDVQGVPTFKFWKNGTLLEQFAGANPDKLENAIKTRV